MNFRYAVLLILLSTCWAGTYIFIKMLDENIDPYTIMIMRGIISTIFLVVILNVFHIPFLSHMKQIKFQLTCIMSGIFIAYMWLATAYSEKTISAATASLLLTTLVPITWLLVIIINRERRFYFLNLIGVFVSLFGVLLIIGYKNIVNINYQLSASVLYVSGLFFFALANVVGKKLIFGTNPLVTTCYSLFYMTIALVVSAYIVHNPIALNYSKESFFALLGLGLISTGVGYIIYFYLSYSAGLVYAAISSYLIPTFGFIFGVILLHEHFEYRQLLCLAVSLIGLMFVQKRVDHRRY